MANAGIADKVYVEETGPVLVSGDYLYINKGYIGDTKIPLADLVPNEANVVAGVDGNSHLIYKTVSVYDKDGAFVAGTMGDAALGEIAATDVSARVSTVSVAANENNSAFKVTSIGEISGNTSVAIANAGYATTKSGIITADMISQNPQKVSNGEATYSVNDNHDLTVTFSALSQGILINSGNLVGGDDVRVYFDSVTFDPEPNDTAKTYIRLYDGQNYTNTSGMTPSIGSDNIGIQINSSSRFETHGGVLSCTITFTNFRYEKL